MTGTGAFLFLSLFTAGALASRPVAPAPLQCPPGEVFTPFSLVPPPAMPTKAHVHFADGKDATLAPIAGKIVRLDLCSDEARGTFTFARMVIRSMKVLNLKEVPEYTTLEKASGDIVEGLQEAAFGDLQELRVRLHVTPGREGRLVQIHGWNDGAVAFLTFAEGSLTPDGGFLPSEGTPVFAATLDPQDRIALSEGACGDKGLLEKYAFRVGSFSMQTEACRVTSQFGSRFTFTRLTVAGKPEELTHFKYKHTHHNANDGWDLRLGAVAYELITTDDVELVGESPTDVKIFRWKKDGKTMGERKIVSRRCSPLSCDLD